jgi:hypothetical protein
MDKFRVERLQIRSFLAIFLSELRFVRFWAETPKIILKGETPQNHFEGRNPKFGDFVDSPHEIRAI